MPFRYAILLLSSCLTFQLNAAKDSIEVIGMRNKYSLEINYNKAKEYISSLIKQKEIPYGAFLKNATNCARFVTDTIIASSTNKKIKSHLKKSNLFTPSPIGNVIKGTTTNKIYKIIKQQLNLYNNRSILKEYRTSFFNRFDIEPNLIGTELPNKEVFQPENGTWLGGIGSGAWFKIQEKTDCGSYKITRFNSKGIKDFEDYFAPNKSSFNLKETYTFIYPTNCQEAFIKQNKNLYSFKKIEKNILES